ncbi:MAG: stage II sporulation protein R [Acutalibacteraceae bacterium]|nr:stage II sporulation protein R [Acutalibacteraceae bacterium]
MSKSVLKRIRVSVLVALVFCIIISMVTFDAKCEDLRNNVLRLHIRANSDSEADQALKLKVRDAVLKNTAVQFNKCTNLEEAIITARDSVDEIKATAKQVVRENGYNYEIEVEIGEAYFDTREYDNFTLPAGFYNSVIIKIGKAQGKNWWCVMFPSLCVPSSSARLENSVEKGSAKIAQNASNYKMAFKTVEIYEKIKKIVSNK